MRFNLCFLLRGGTGLGLLFLTSCVESYLPDVVNANTSYLVVDGFINGNGVTRIKLSRSITLATSTPPPVEKGAKIFIVDNAGSRYALTEKTSGNYQSDSLLLNPARQYQLRIGTTNAATYESALVPLKVTPPFDDLSWKLSGTDVRFSLSTHDPQQQSRYYRWSYIETWEFHSAYESRLEYSSTQKILVARVTPIYTCWRTEQPSTIKQGSTAQLAQDVLADVGLFTVPSRAERFKIRYSVLVSQYAETAEEFAYYELLRKNTEAVGGVNDPLPSQLTGNVHRLDNPAEPVLGFVSAHTVQRRRLFIDRTQLPYLANADYDTPYTTCTMGEELLADPKANPPLRPPHTRIFSDISNTPIDYLIKGTDTLGYTGSSYFCVDCRLRGSNVKPSFW